MLQGRDDVAAVKPFAQPHHGLDRMLGMGIVPGCLGDVLIRLFRRGMVRRWCILGINNEIYTEYFDELKSVVSSCCFVDGLVFVGTAGGTLHRLELYERTANLKHVVNLGDDNPSGSRVVSIDAVSAHIEAGSQYVASATFSRGISLRVDGSVKWSFVYSTEGRCRAMGILQICGTRSVLTDCTLGGFLVWSFQDGSLVRWVRSFPGFIASIKTRIDPNLKKEHQYQKAAEAVQLLLRRLEEETAAEIAAKTRALTAGMEESARIQSAWGEAVSGLESPRPTLGSFVDVDRLRAEAAAAEASAADRKRLVTADLDRVQLQLDAARARVLEPAVWVMSTCGDLGVFTSGNWKKYSPLLKPWSSRGSDNDKWNVKSYCMLDGGTLYAAGGLALHPDRGAALCRWGSLACGQSAYSTTRLNAFRNYRKSTHSLLCAIL